MSFIVYIDDFDASIVDKVEANPRRSASTGVRLAVHERGTTPDFSNGLSAGPGTDTSISVSTVHRRRLGEPFDECRNEKFKRGSDAVYTRTECIEECLQDKVIVSQCCTFPSNTTRDLLCLPFTFAVFVRFSEPRVFNSFGTYRRRDC